MPQQQQTMVQNIPSHGLSQLWLRGRSAGGKTKRGDISCFGNHADWFQDPFLSNVRGNAIDHLLKSLQEPGTSLGRQLGKKAAFQCPTNLLYCYHVRQEDLSLSTARALSRSFIVSLVLDSKNSGHPSSQRSTWRWEKFSKKTNTERNVLFISYVCQLWYALIMINNSKLFGPLFHHCLLP